jgi:hypothetical protein
MTRLYLILGGAIACLAIGAWLGVTITNGKWYQKEAHILAVTAESQKRIQANADNAATEYQAQIEIAKAGGAVLDGQLSRLRADIQAIGTPSPASSPIVARVAGLFDQCASEVVRLAKDADSLAGKVTGWQQWYIATKD